MSEINEVFYELLALLEDGLTDQEISEETGFPAEVIAVWRADFESYADQHQMNEFEMIQVAADLERKGVTQWGWTQGNDCIWVWYGMINAYYIFRNGKIWDIQID